MANTARNEFQPGIILAAARLLLIDKKEYSPNSDNVRFGKNGSLSIKLSENTYFDNEAGVGGGLLDFVMNYGGASNKNDAANWLKNHGLITNQPAYQPTPPRTPPAAPRPAPGMSAAEVWERCKPASPQHPYARRKELSGAPLDGLRIMPDGEVIQGVSGGLVVPAYAIDGTLQSLQLIPPSGGQKMNLKAAPIAGSRFIVGNINPNGIVYICEGVGQAWACWQATGNAGVVCFGAGNMRKVATDLRKQYPAITIVMVPDSGKELDSEKIAIDVGGAVARMPEGEESNFDVNDFAQREGHDVLAGILEEAAYSKSLVNQDAKEGVDEISVDILKAFIETPPPLDLILPGLLAGTVGAIVSPGGAGKSMLALEMSVLVATGHDISGFGARVERATGKVVFLAAEDPKIALQHRLHALGQHMTNELCQDFAANFEMKSIAGMQVDICTAHWFNFMLKIAEGKRLMFVDTLRRFHLLNENDSGEMAQLVGILENIAKRTGCSIIFLHHTNKSAAMNGLGDVQQASRGSSVLVDNIRWQSFVSVCTREEAKLYGIEEARRGYFVRTGVSKQNYGPPVEDIWCERKEGGILVPTVLSASDVTKKKGGQREQA